MTGPGKSAVDETTTCNTAPLAWIDGSLVPFVRAGLPLADLGVVAGAAITETGRTFGHQPFRLREHVERLTGSCSALGFPQRYSAHELLAAAESLIQLNAGLIAPELDLGFALFVTAGQNPTYLEGRHEPFGSTVIHTFPLPLAQWREPMQNGVRLRIPSAKQIPSALLPVQHKIRNRLHWWLADREAHSLEPGSKALLLDSHDCVTETSTSCFYAVINREILTPEGDVLRSLSSRVVEELARAADIPFRRCRIDRGELSACDEAFLSSSPLGLLPVRRIDGTDVGGRLADGEFPGPVFLRLLNDWSRIVSVDLRRQILVASDPVRIAAEPNA